MLYSQSAYFSLGCVAFSIFLLEILRIGWKYGTIRSSFMASFNSRFFTSFNTDIPEVEIDKKQIKMALINLIDNAIQAKSDKIRLNAYYNSVLDIIRIEVADEGIGIREEDKDKLFFPYFSTKKEGTGLGLAIVNSIISKHRGYIRVQDNKPKGTQFIIELPLGQK